MVFGTLKFLFSTIHLSLDLIYLVEDFVNFEKLTDLGWVDSDRCSLRIVSRSDYFNRLKYTPNFLSEKPCVYFVSLYFAIPLTTELNDFVGVYQLKDRLVGFHVEPYENSNNEIEYYKHFNDENNSVLITGGLKKVQDILNDKKFDDCHILDSEFKQLYLDCKRLNSDDNNGIEAIQNLFTSTIKNELLKCNIALLNLIHKFIKSCIPKNTSYIEMHEDIMGILSFKKAISFKRSTLYTYTLVVYDEINKKVGTYCLNDKVYGDKIVIMRSEFKYDNCNKVCLRITFNGVSITRDITDLAKMI